MRIRIKMKIRLFREREGEGEGERNVEGWMCGRDGWVKEIGLG
jgi:hypothetical protein